MIIITEFILIVLCTLIVNNINAVKTNCTMIDKTKFKESFVFNYGGGSIGLEFKFDFKSDKIFKFHECNFEIRDVKTSTYGSNSYKKQANKRKLSGLQACTKYKVTLSIKNVATSESFEYENYVLTKPDPKTSKIQLTTDNISNSSVDLRWTTNTKGCLLNYEVVLTNDKKEIVNKISNIQDTSMSYDDLLPSQSYSIQVNGYDDKNSKVSSNVVNFKTNSSDVDINNFDISLHVIKVLAHSVEFMWNESGKENDLNYHLVVVDDDDKLIASKNLTKNSITIGNLKSCTLYHATITALTENATVDFFTLPEKPSEIKKVTFESYDDKSIISWSKPEINADCITDYTIKYHEPKGSDSFSSQWTVTKNETSLVVNKLRYSKKIFIHVYANWNTSPSESGTKNTKSWEFEHFSIDDFAVKAIREFRLSATEVQLRWSFNTFYSDILQEFQIIFNGETLLTNKTLVNLNIEACDKNYTILFRCKSASGNYGANVTYHTNLNDNDVQLSAINDTDFHVEQNRENVLLSWKPNKLEAPCVAHYEVNFLKNLSTLREPKMEIKELNPCITYQVGITPISKSATRGEMKYFDFVTSVLVPRKPSKPILVTSGNQELKIASSLADVDRICVSVTPTSIEFKCNNQLVIVNVTQTDSQYVTKISGLNPNTKYRCTANVRNHLGVSESSDVAEFHTQQDSPQPPNDIKITIHENNKISVTWKADNSTGFADYYKVHVHLMKILFKIDNECHENFKNVSIFEASMEEITLSDLLPFSNYKLKIIASNDYGSSNFSEEISFRTPPSKPLKPRDIKIDFKANDNSLISANILWKPPCMMNGKFSLYTVTINGYRKGLDSYKETKASTNTEIEYHDLREGFKYEIEIQAVNQQNGGINLSGDVLRKSFETSSGIPLKEDLKDWTTIGSNTEKLNPENIEILIKRRVLLSSVGDIIGIAFLLFSANCGELPQPQHGYLSEVNTQLPASQSELNCSILYQQTRILENPLNYEDEIISSNEVLNSHSVRFIIGNEKCPKQFFKSGEYCNGALASNEKYGLIARIFTNNGFRDTEPVYFETGNVSQLSMFLQTASISTIIAACALLPILFSLILVILCCCCSMKKKKRNKSKKKESAETVENLLSFTSYCVIDKNPTPKNQFDHLL